MTVLPVVEGDGGVDYQELLGGLKRFGSTETEICVHGLGVLPEQVHENVIVAPWWEPQSMPALGGAGEVTELSDCAASLRAWDIVKDGMAITYIKTGIGAPQHMDAVLSLGLTPCKRILFLGSVGALDDQIGIGDIVVPEYSVCGDGASRYLADAPLANSDVFGEKAYPDWELLDRLKEITARACKAHNVRWHSGKTFSIDTIFAQFAHIDEILGMGCNVIEEETAAAFRAAAMMGIPMAALFSVSDNTVAKKSLVSGRTKEEMEYRRYVRRELFPKIIFEFF